VRYQAVITREHHQDQLVYLLELASGVPPPDGNAIAEALREHLKVRGEVKLVPSGALPPDAKRIDDRRVWK
jgi:hypothetical protein